MAQLKKHILGEVTGGLGDVVFKKIKGENYIASRPTDYTMDMKSEAVQRRARFRIAMKLAQSMNKSLRFKAIWKSKAPEGLSAFNFMMQRNYPYVQAETIANGIKLTPDVGFGVGVTAVNLTSTGLTVDISAIGTNAGIITASEPNIGMTAVLFLSNPADPLNPAYDYLTLQSGNLSTNLNTALSFEVVLSSQETQLFNLYQDQKVFFVLTTLDASGAVVHYSSTVLAV